MKKWMFIVIEIFIILIILIVTIVNNTKINSKNILEPKEYKNENTIEFLNEQEKEYYRKVNEQTLDKVSMVIKENTLSKTGATIIITDKNELPYYFVKDSYIIEKNIFGNLWIKIFSKSGYAIEPLGIHGPNGITEIEIDWTERYGELNNGKYRLVMIDGLYTEFNIDKNI